MKKLTYLLLALVLLASLVLTGCQQDILPDTDVSGQILNLYGMDISVWSRIGASSGSSILKTVPAACPSTSSMSCGGGPEGAVSPAKSV